MKELFYEIVLPTLAVINFSILGYLNDRIFDVLAVLLLLLGMASAVIKIQYSVDRIAAVVAAAAKGKVKYEGDDFKIRVKEAE